MKTQTQIPKRIYFRTLASGKLSLGEYINVRWNNITAPFYLDNLAAQAAFITLIQTYKAQTNRTVEFVAKDRTPLPSFLANL